MKVKSDLPKNNLLSVCELLAFILLLVFSINLNAQDKTGPKIDTEDPMKIQPKGEKPVWGKNIDPQMLAVIEQFQAFEQGDPTNLTAFQLRNGKTPTGAVMSILAKTGMKPMKPKVDIGHKVLDVGPEQGILVRTYTPISKKKNEKLPVIVYFHGGGWVIADLDTYEASAKALSAQANAVVVSVAYRQAPENPFPAAHEDAFAAYKYVVDHTDEFNGNSKKIAIAGESAGGNLAVATAIKARDENIQMPVHILSVYPIADGDTTSDSYDKYNNALPLSRPFMEWFFDKYKEDWLNSEDSRISLVDADLSGLPPTTIVNAEIDPLESEGGELADKLEAAGVDVKRKLYEGVTHEFFGMAAILEQAVEAQKFAVDRMKKNFK